MVGLEQSDTVVEPEADTHRGLEECRGMVGVLKRDHAIAEQTLQRVPSATMRA